MGKVMVYESEIEELVSFIRNTFKNQKEIFLHMLLCNSAYALDRLQYECLTVPPPELCINVLPDKTNNTLTIVDNGVGMTQSDLVDLTSFSSSRAQIFMQAIASGAHLNTIWQFGLGFYFAYLVADKVVVTTQHNFDDQYVWESYAGASSIVTSDTHDPNLVCGSRTTLYLKRDQLEFLENRRLRGLIMKYSSFITYPIHLPLTQTSELKISLVKDRRRRFNSGCFSNQEEDGKVEEVDKKMMNLKVY